MRAPSIALALSRRQQFSMGSPTPADAPWRAAFLSHLEQMDSPDFVLSTLHRQRSESPPRLVPRARTVIFRGMWACLSVNPKNPADLNPNVYRTHLPTLTSDARMDKASELAETASGPHAPSPAQSGGGGPVEAVFWAAPAKTQWRIRGRAYIIGPDIESAAAAPVRDALAPHMRRTGPSQGWSWSRELTAHFGNLSPVMRGTFRNPAPGTPRAEEPDKDSGLGQGHKLDNLDDEVARDNFRVVVLVPDEVDRVDLSDPMRGRRWNYRAGGTDGTGEWKTTELWP